MVIEILRDEQGHRRLFEGFLREYEVEGFAGEAARAVTRLPMVCTDDGCPHGAVYARYSVLSRER